MEPSVGEMTCSKAGSHCDRNPHTNDMKHPIVSQIFKSNDRTVISKMKEQSSESQDFEAYFDKPCFKQVFGYASDGIR